MVLGIGILIPGAIIVARYYKEQISSRWLRLHIFLISLGTLCIVLSIYCLSLFENGMTFDMKSNHTLISWTMIFFILIQIGLGFMAMKRYSPDSPVESKTDIVHRFVGQVCGLFGLLGLFTGIGKLFKYQKDQEKHSVIYIYYLLFLVWLIMLSAAILTLEKLRGRSSRYSKGNIFIAASAMGVNTLFSMKIHDRMKAINDTSPKRLSIIKSHETLERTMMEDVKNHDFKMKNELCEEPINSPPINIRNWDQRRKSQDLSQLLSTSKIGNSFNDTKATHGTDLFGVYKIEDELASKEKRQRSYSITKRSSKSSNSTLEDNISTDVNSKKNSTQIDTSKILVEKSSSQNSTPPSVMTKLKRNSGIFESSSTKVSPATKRNSKVIEKSLSQLSQDSNRSDILSKSRQSSKKSDVDQ
ncbi:hypothetical protein BC833DRAFT_603257 [Globomyces pollinis-pini]|nr:hypothetical protein BC833DRAFT_603257 [Globomyces pollinis-pini]